MSKKRFLVYFSILISLLLLILILEPFKIVWVNGNSMYPTLKNNSFLLVYKNPPKINDIVIFTHNNRGYVKRLIAIEGDVLEFKDEGLYVNGILKVYYKGYYRGTDKIMIPKGFVFVVGDNYKNSDDSLFRYFQQQEYLIPLSEIEFSRTYD